MTSVFKHWNHQLSNKALTATLLLSSIAFASGPNAPSTSTVKVMAYNVENLFDLSHDEGKEDWAYLPLSSKGTAEHRAACSKVSNPFFRNECLNLDWNREVLNAKIENIANVISTSFEGAGPDILILQEVENFAALEELQKRGLRNKGYKEIILIEGPDKRGIDVAILSKLPLIAAQSHTVELPRKEDGSDAHPTRGILEATFKVGSKKLTVYANHWPSQSNPTANRVAAAQTLSDAAKAATARGEAVIALGDFNSLLAEINGPVGAVLKQEFIDGIEYRLENVAGKTKMPGSHWYRGSWSFLDRFYVTQESERLGLKVKWDSLDVHAPDFALRVNEYRRRDGTIERTFIPYRFDAKQKNGFADHLPVVVEISL